MGKEGGEQRPAAMRVVRVDGVPAVGRTGGAEAAEHRRLLPADPTAKGGEEARDEGEDGEGEGIAGRREDPEAGPRVAGGDVLHVLLDEERQGDEGEEAGPEVADLGGPGRPRAVLDCGQAAQEAAELQEGGGGGSGGNGAREERQGREGRPVLVGGVAERRLVLGTQAELRDEDGIVGQQGTNDGQ